MGVWGCLMHACRHAHTCACVYDIIVIPQQFPHWGMPFAIEMIIFNYMHLHACMHGAPPTCPQPHPPTPMPQGGPNKSVEIQ